MSAYIHYRLSQTNQEESNQDYLYVFNSVPSLSKNISKSRAPTVPAKSWITVLEYRLIFHKGQNFKLLYIANGYNIPQIPYLQKK